MAASVERAGPLQRRPRFVLVSDLDWTMVDHADPTHAKLLAFNRLWVTQFAQDSVLVFSTGRSPELFHALAAQVPLLTPDILVCSVGSEILVKGQADAEWEAYLNQGWDRAAAAAVAAKLPELQLQRPSEQRPHKVSYKLTVADPERVLGTLREGLAAAGLEASVIFSGGSDLDILPSRASKGKVLSFLLRQIEGSVGAPPSGVMVCGDSGNDVELFAVPGVMGCMVANAHTELRAWYSANGEGRKIFAATQDGPGGIREALLHFGLAEDGGSLQQPGSVRQAVAGQLAWFEDWVNGSVERDTAAGLAHLESTLEEGFEYVHPRGEVMGRQAFLDWFAKEGYGCRAPSGGANKDEARYRMWVDRYSERQLAEGLWLARYVELHQLFQAGGHSPAERADGQVPAEPRDARWASAVVQRAGQGYKWLYVQETTAAEAASRA